MEPRPMFTQPDVQRPIKPTPEQLRQAQTDITHFFRTLPAMVQSLIDDLYSTYGERPSDGAEDPRPPTLGIVYTSELPDLIRDEAKKYLQQRDRVFHLAFNRANADLYNETMFAPTEPTDESAESDPDEDRPF